MGLAAGNAAAGVAFIGSGTADAATGVAALCEWAPLLLRCDGRGGGARRGCGRAKPPG